MRLRAIVLVGAATFLSAGLTAGLLLTGAQAAKAPPRVTKEQLAWWQALQKLRVPPGCFSATFPKVEWVRATCRKPPPTPYMPARGPRPYTIGNSNDYSARVSNLIVGAEGSFDASNATSETDGGANIYSLQINTNRFVPSLCSGHAGCLGWEQFIYSSGFQGIYIQYWMINYNATCPAGWMQGPPGYTQDCYRNSTSRTVAQQAVSNLPTMRLTGDTRSGNDTVEMFWSGTNASAADTGSPFNLATHWTDAEFLIVGDGNNSVATFGANTTIVVRTVVHHNSTAAPSCQLEGFTGESNNLNLVGTAPISMGPAPAIASQQSNVLTTASGCQSADGTGDTHLRTFNGLLYDFQATGEFILAQDPYFVVQNRQVSGAPTWPNAAVNTAVATRMGTSRIAVCLPNQLQINGKTTKAAQGTPIRLPGGVDVLLKGNVYLIRGANGDNVRAEVNNGWINVSVGLGSWPDNVHGLLANANGNVSQLATRTGVVLNEPLSFATLYHRYGDSWRVKPSESLLCGKPVRSSSPTASFYAGNLNPKVARRARSICLKFGVRIAALLDACTIDVAVIGKPEAARAYVGATAPISVAPPPR